VKRWAIISLIILPLHALFSSAAVAQTRTPNDVMADLSNATSESAMIYKHGGMSGLVAKSQSCYEDINKYRFYCIYIDIAAREIDDRVRTAHPRLPPNEYFSDDNFLPRAQRIFDKASVSAKDQKEYIAGVKSIIANDKTIAAIKLPGS